MSHKAELFMGLSFSQSAGWEGIALCICTLDFAGQNSNI